MPLGQFQLATAAVLPAQIATHSIERGVLTALSASWNTYPIAWGNAFIRLGLSTADTTPGSLVLCLASGYLTAKAGPIWSGAITLQPSMLLTIIANTVAVAQINVTWVTE